MRHVFEFEEMEEQLGEENCNGSSVTRKYKTEYLTKVVDIL